MKILSNILSLLIFATLLSCGPEKKTKEKAANKQATKDSLTILENAELKNILTDNHLEGCIAIYDLNKNELLTNSKNELTKAHLPASTFKIPHTLIALHVGATTAHQVLKWDGKKRTLQIWEKDMTFKEAFQNSCAPCYQELARKEGYEALKDYTELLKYGHLDIDSSNYDRFWLEGTSHINALEQVIFLKDIHQKKWALFSAYYETLSDFMYQGKYESYDLYAKTGWSIQNGINNGWWVGILVKEEQAYSFAINISKAEEDISSQDFSSLRSYIGKKAFTHLNIK